MSLPAATAGAMMSVTRPHAPAVHLPAPTRASLGHDDWTTLGNAHRAPKSNEYRMKSTRSDFELHVHVVKATGRGWRWCWCGDGRCCCRAGFSSCKDACGEHVDLQSRERATHLAACRARERVVITVAAGRCCRCWRRSRCGNCCWRCRSSAASCRVSAALAALPVVGLVAATASSTLCLACRGSAASARS